MGAPFYPPRGGAISSRALSLFSVCGQYAPRLVRIAAAHIRHDRGLSARLAAYIRHGRSAVRAAAQSHRARSLYSACAANMRRVLSASPPRTFVMTVGFPLGKSLRIVSSCHRTRRSFMARVRHATPAAEPTAPYILAVFRAYREADEIRRALILRSESAHTPPPAAVHTARDNPRRGSS